MSANDLPPLAGILARCGALTRARDFAGARLEADAAIACRPGSAELHHLRSIIWRALGDYVRAAEDYAACLAFDPHFPDAARIRAAVKEVTDWFLSDRVADSQWPADTISDPALRAAVGLRLADLNGRRARLDRPSCDMPCPSQCCYFDAEPHTCGVHVAPRQIGDITAWLDAEGLSETDYLARQPEAACSPAVRAREDCFVESDDGGRWLWYPRRDARAAPAIPPDARPKNVDYRELGWLSPQSRACRFVGDRGCLVHEIGNPPGLPVCRSFLCFTAFVFAVLTALRVCRRDELLTWRIDDLHRSAVPALMALARFVCEDAELARADAAAREALGRAVAADLRSDQNTAASCLSEYAGACRTTDAVRDERLLQVRQALTQFGREATCE